MRMLLRSLISRQRPSFWRPINCQQLRFLAEVPSLIHNERLKEDNDAGPASRSAQPFKYAKGDGVVGGKYKNKSISDIWDDLKAKHPGCLLMIQIGDFYEMLNEDARDASRILDIVLTKRRIRLRYSAGVERQVDMAGIPCRSLQKHLPKLTRAGIKVIVVQQQTGIEAKREWGKSMNREVTRIVTPGTLYEDELLSPGENNHLAAVIASSWSEQDDKQSVGLAWADVSTGELWAQSVSVKGLREQLGRIDAKEVLLPEEVDLYRPTSLQWLFSSSSNDDSATMTMPSSFSPSSSGPMLTIVEDSFFSDDGDKDDSTNIKGTKNTSSSPGMAAMSSLERRAVQCLIMYVNSTLKPNFEWARPRSANREILAMDSGTRQALEVVRSQATKSLNGSLLKEVDGTVTAGGARLLRTRMEAPMTNIKEITHRLDAVEYLVTHYDEVTAPIRRILRTLHDPTRAFQRLRVGRWTLKDVVDVFSALDVARTIADETLPGEAQGSRDINEWSNILAGSIKVSPNDLTREGVLLVERSLKSAPDGTFDDLSKKKSKIVSMGELHSELERALFSSKHYALLTSKGTIQKDEFEDVEEEEVRSLLKRTSKTGSDEDVGLDDVEESTSGSSITKKRKRSSSSKTPTTSFAIGRDATENDEGDDDTSGSSTANVSSQGRLFKPGYSFKYDELFEETNGLSSRRVEQLQRKYQQEYDPKIKIGRGGTGQGTRSNTLAMNYVVEVPKSVSLDPQVFSPVQSLKQRTRYTTAELNVLNAESLTSRDALSEVERSIADYLCGHCLALATELERVFSALAQLDVACSSAHVAKERSLTRPVVDNQGTVRVRNLRHLVVERNNANFVSNDLHLTSNGDPSVWLITGPNMGGKSTFLRSAASSVILAQAGLFVPSTEARIGVVDRVFARIGASDDISNNRSTFMVEMEETAQFLSQATKDSLVIVDELGRGTSPQEGFAIAQAALEELVKIGSRSLFATHFHRLATIPQGPCDVFPKRISRYTTEVILVKAQPNDEAAPQQQHIVFTYKMKEGSASSSFGINVARMAGVPSHVLARAEMLMRQHQLDEGRK